MEKSETGREALGKISVAYAVGDAVTPPPFVPSPDLHTPLLAPKVRHPRHWLTPMRFQLGLVALFVLFGAWILIGLFSAQVTVGHSKVAAHVRDAALTRALHKEVDHYQVAVAYPDKTTKRFALRSIGFTLDDSASVTATRKAERTLSHRLAWWRQTPAVLVYKKNPAVFNDFVAKNISITAQPSQDAVLSVEGGKIKITDAVTGKQYGLNSPDRAIRTAAIGLQTSPIKLQTLDVNPALTTKSLEPYKHQLEQILNQPARLTIGDRTVTPSPEDISTWLDIAPNDKTKKIDITVNSGKVVEYLNRIAAASIHPARAQVQVSMPDGSAQVLIAGENGVDITNKTGIASTLADNLLGGKGFSYSLPVRLSQFETVNTGYYPKWIEVDLTNKRLYAYEYTNLVNTQLVSAGAPATPTVVGQYNIYAKFDQQDMRGANVDGSSYFQPHVQWINYFYRDYAIHGNYWRPTSYFGNINSSHGCVGLRNDDALWVYNWAPVGTPIVVHK